MNAPKIDLSRLAPEDVKQRRAPSQKRGEDTCAAILAATASILAETGSTALTTNHIARRAGINIATLYRYYSDVDDVLVALYDQQASERHAVLVEIMGKATTQPWQDTIGDLIDRVAETRQRQPGSSALRHKMLTNPRLIAIERNKALAAGDLVGGIMERYFGIPFEQGHRAALVVTDVVTSTMDLWDQDTPRLDPHKIAELKKALIAYLGLYLP